MFVCNYFQNKVLGAIHIHSIHDQNGKLIYEDKSQSAESARPWFIANCTEKLENVKIIAETFEKEILECTDMNMEYDGKTVAVSLKTYVMMDSKLIDMATGLGGAYCNCCTASEDDGLNLQKIKQGRIPTLVYTYKKFGSFFILILYICILYPLYYLLLEYLGM